MLFTLRNVKQREGMDGLHAGTPKVERRVVLGHRRQLLLDTVFHEGFHHMLASDDDAFLMHAESGTENRERRVAVWRWTDLVVIVHEGDGDGGFLNSGELSAEIGHV